MIDEHCNLKDSKRYKRRQAERLKQIVVSIFSASFFFPFASTTFQGKQSEKQLQNTVGWGKRTTKIYKKEQKGYRTLYSPHGKASILHPQLLSAERT